MQKKQYIKMAIAIVVLIAVLTGVVFYVRYQIKLYRTVILMAEKIVLLEDFAVKSFPEQVTIYNNMIKQK